MLLSLFWISTSNKAQLVQLQILKEVVSTEA